ncbi:MAG TPA: phosphatase PAP2 family protein [Pseudolabrys sp.]|nr:phosphatase PAP2 family protein [Pseudolabrys sp.]
MAWDAATLRRLDGMIWGVVAAVATLVLLAATLDDFTIRFASFALPAGTGLMLLIAAGFYRCCRRDMKLASALEGTAQVVAFAAVAAPLSYVAAAWAAPLPLHDASLDAMDRAMGLDWRGLLATMERAPALHAFMRLAYLSLTAQMTAVVLLLGFSGRLMWLRVYVLAFVFSALVTIAISALFPVEGVWLHYGFTDARGGILPISHTSWPVFLGLRDGSFRALMAVGAEGIISFPSLHAALAVIMIAAVWPVPIARWVGLAINLSMLAATPINGSHYFVDVLAGIAVASLSLLAARTMVARFGPGAASAKQAFSPVAISGLRTPSG